MTRNLSFKTDDDFDDKLYSISKKKGMTKSAFIKHELGKLIDAEEGETPSNKIFSNSTSNSDIHVDILNEEKKTNFTDKTKESQINISDSSTNPPVKMNDSATNESIMTEEKKVEEKRELKDLSSLKNLKQDEQKPVDDVNRLDNLVINKTSTSESKEQNNNINKNRIVTETRPKAKFTIRKVKRVNDEETQGTGLTERDIEHKVNKLLEEKKFSESFKDMHGKVDKVCEDGKCLKEKVNSLELKLGKIDEVCENGKCIRNEIGEIKKELNEFKELKKSLDELKDGVIDIRGGVVNLDKKSIKKEPCPQCSWGVEEGSSNCPNCGLEIKEWYDEKGNKLDWIPYKQRHQH